MKTKKDSGRRGVSRTVQANKTMTQRGGETVASPPPGADQLWTGLEGGRPSGSNATALLKAS